MFKIIFVLSSAPLFLFAFVAVLNVFTFPRLTSQRPSNTNPPVSILIPMRNESAVIGETVKSLLGQDYPNLEILLLNDHSTDGSDEIAQRAANCDPRLKVLTGKPLPAGWFGKAWACQQLAAQASGEYLLFTDADVRLQPGAVSALMAEAARTQSDLLTAWPRQETVSWGERLVVPLMGFSILAYLPALAVHYIPWPIFAAAIGQCLLFKRSAYDKIGGHETVKDKIADDMAFAYATKGQRLRFRMVDSNGLLTCRMYHNWSEVRDGYAKNILAGHGNSLAFLIFSTVFHWWMFVVPWIVLVFLGIVNGEWSFATLAILSITVRALTAASTGQRVKDSLFMPVSVFLMTLIALQAVKWRFNGGPQWKGRKLAA